MPVTPDFSSVIQTDNTNPSDVNRVNSKPAGPQEIEDYDGRSLVAFNLCLLEPNGSIRLKTVRGNSEDISDYYKETLNFISGVQPVQELVDLVRSPNLLTINKNGYISAQPVIDPGVLDTRVNQGAALYVGSYYADVEYGKARGIMTIEHTFVINVYQSHIYEAPYYNLDMTQDDGSLGYLVPLSHTHVEMEHALAEMEGEEPEVEYYTLDQNVNPDMLTPQQKEELLRQKYREQHEVVELGD